MLKIHFYLTFIVGFVIRAGCSDVLHNSKLLTKLLLSRSLPYEDCGSQYDIVSLQISSCSFLPCEMVRGTTVDVQTSFNDYGSNTQFLKHSVRWIFNSIKTGATITPDPCDGQDECLSNVSEGKSYSASVYVNNTLPVMRGTMLWEAGDDYSNDLICFKVPVIIKLE